MCRVITPGGSRPSLQSDVRRRPTGRADVRWFGRKTPAPVGQPVERSMRSLLTCAVLFITGCNCGDRGGGDAGTGGGSDSGSLDAGAVGTDGGNPGSDAGARSDAGASSDAGLACDGLAVDACRATTGCRADFCAGCTCTSTYQGCHLAGSRPPICPLGPCPQPACCSSNADCLGNTFCASPESPPSCGACNNTPSTCTTDAQCAPQICEPRPCACAAEHACVPGCSESNPCHTGLACNATTRRCEVVACTTDAQCASTFSCKSLVCVRRPCTDDTQCGVGACVNGQCFDDRGQCQTPVP